jgi:hypothetical protein
MNARLLALRTAIVLWLYLLIRRVSESPRVPEPIKRWVAIWGTETAYLLEYEPSWFSEFGLAIGSFLWGFFALTTDDFKVSGWGYILPFLAIALSSVRFAILFKLWYGARVVMTGLSALLMAYVWWGLVGRYGVIPSMGWVAGGLASELLTAAKFSLPCARELRDEYYEWRLAQ